MPQFKANKGLLLSQLSSMLRHVAGLGPKGAEFDPWLSGCVVFISEMLCLHPLLSIQLYMHTSVAAGQRCGGLASLLG